MKDRVSQTDNMVDHLIDAIVRKLRANRGILLRSASYGRLVWRRKKKDGQIEVDLEPNFKSQQQR